MKAELSAVREEITSLESEINMLWVFQKESRRSKFGALPLEIVSDLFKEKGKEKLAKV